ncbi:MAG TPA: RDD family protein [Verrucomicrobiae bacterium]|nr:RDD family protein [Verrucomicrobiae bacterium]
MNWYYVNAAGQQAGPVDDAALDSLAASGAVHAETLVWTEGMPNWQPHREARPNALNVPAPALAGASAGAGPSPGVEEVVCAECGGVFPSADTIRIGSSRVCAKCKPVFVQKMREGMNVGVAGGVGAFRYGGFWIRFVAKFLDGLIMGVIIGIPGMLIMGAVMAGARNNPAAVGTGVIMFQLLASLGRIVLQVLYSGFFLSKYGATPGKMACGLKVVTAEGRPVSFARGCGRGLAEVLSGMICLIGYIMAAFDDEKQALHDRICNTRVIYK